MNGKYHIGTSGWSYDDWIGPFYPRGTAAADFLPIYAEQFPAVEVDSTYYRPPTAKMAKAWACKTSPNFRFFLKASGEVMHKRVLVDYDGEMEAMLAALQPLGEKVRCLLLQFGYFNRAAFSTARPFFDRLDDFLKRFARRIVCAVEIRNKTWFTQEYLDLLRGHGAVAVLAEQAWMPPINQLVDSYDVITGPFSYVRLIGDRQGIEKITMKWNKTVVDRSEDLRHVKAALRQLTRYNEAFIFVNNHYAGHGPATARHLQATLEETIE